MLQFSFPPVFAVFRVRQKAQSINNLAVEMRRHNQPVIISPHIEHLGLTRFDGHLVVVVGMVMV